MDILKYLQQNMGCVNQKTDFFGGGVIIITYYILLTKLKQCLSSTYWTEVYYS